MFAFTNKEILDELKRSGEQFASLFVQNEAEFIPLPQSGNRRKEADRYAAQVNDVITVAHHNNYTNKWTFRSFVMIA